MTASGFPDLPVASIHHFACTGGTLLARCIAAMPNVLLLSEIDPLSPLPLLHPPRFSPSDLMLQARFGPRPISQDRLEALFTAMMSELARQCRSRGERLVLRDHAHSQYCVGAELPVRPSVHRMLDRVPGVTLRSLVTVRHPMASFLSLDRNAWLHFRPTTIDEYARRYHAFLDDHAALPMMRYEDFVADPETQGAAICALIGLEFRVEALRMIGTIRLSGDSGRSGAEISPRPPRPAPPGIAAEAAASTAFRRLLDRLSYSMSMAEDA